MTRRARGLTELPSRALLIAAVAAIAITAIIAIDTPASAQNGDVTLSAGLWHTCVLHETGEVECWGNNEYGRADAPTERFSAVSAGQEHSCGLRETGAVKCWGSYDSVPGGRFSAVSVGAVHSCGLRETGAVKCWGSNKDGQTDAPEGRFSAVSVGGLYGFRTRLGHTCGLRETGAVECWGSNKDGQTNAPEGRFSAVSAGAYHTCGLRETGAVECWGNNDYGQADAPAGRFSAVSAGRKHNCGLRETGAVECWGNNDYGQASDWPSGRFSAVSAGGYHSCGLRETGEVECWGSNYYGQADVPEDLSLATSQTSAQEGCPEPHLLFRVAETTSSTPRLLTRSARLDTTCQVDGLPSGSVRPADHYAFTLDEPARVSAKLSSDAFAPHLFLTDANGQYFNLVGTEAEGGTWLSLLGSRVADGDGNAIIAQAEGAQGDLTGFGRALEPGSYWLFAVSGSGSRTGDYQLEVEYERIGDSGLHQQIVERFAPVLRFEEDEKFFPVPVELMIRFSRLRYTQNGQNRSKAAGTYELADLISYNGQDSYLDLPNTDRHRRATGDRVVYARVATVGTRGTLVQYWFFYLYNETGGGALGLDHEGDWEGIQLWFAGLRPDELLTANMPTQLGYAAHESGWALRQGASCVGADGVLSPSVYVARNRHASYIAARGGGPIAQALRTRYGNQLKLDKSLDGQDQFQGNGVIWALRGREVPYVEGEIGYEIRLLPTDLERSWLAWDGRWGDRSGTGGPLGPAFKSHFWTPPVFISGWSQAVFTCPDPDG